MQKPSCSLFSRALINRDRTDYQPVEKQSALFSEEFIDLTGKTISLNTLEHELIRKGFNDPRVHSALVCGGLSCPPCNREPSKPMIWAPPSTRV